jgi:hypothetical protein
MHTHEFEQVWFRIRSASVFKHISFSHRRLPKNKISRFLPETLCEIESFGPRSLQEWHEKMEAHNRSLRRGRRMGLFPGMPVTQKLLHTSLDMYMLQLHSDCLAKSLDSFTTFAKRVAGQIRKRPNAQEWWLNRDILIQRKHWFRFCKQVMNLLQLLGFCKNVAGTPAALLWRLSPWPNFSKLYDAARKAREVVGIFKCPDQGILSLTQLYASSA